MQEQGLEDKDKIRVRTLLGANPLVVRTDSNLQAQICSFLRVNRITFLLNAIN